MEPRSWLCEFIALANAGEVTVNRRRIEDKPETDTNDDFTFPPPLKYATETLQATTNAKNHSNTNEAWNFHLHFIDSPIAVSNMFTFILAFMSKLPEHDKDEPIVMHSYGSPDLRMEVINSPMSDSPMMFSYEY